MNIDNIINKSLTMLIEQNKLFQLNSFKFLVTEKGYYCTKYELLKKEKDNKYKEVISSYKKIDIAEFLLKELKGRKNEKR